jgi:hypothetical protein
MLASRGRLASGGIGVWLIGIRAIRVLDANREIVERDVRL